MLEFVMLKDATVYVRGASRQSGATPSWPGGSLPLSPSLGRALRSFLDRRAETDTGAPPVGAATRRVLRAQADTSAVPGSGDVLAEVFAGRGATHLFVFPFEGRAIHEGLAALVVARLQREVPGSFGVSANDYGFHLEAAADYPFPSLLREKDIFADEGTKDELLSSVNVDELARRAFRGIARVSGLVFPGYPGAQKSIRQIQASATLLYEVFAEHEPGNLLLAEARREALRSQLNVEGLTEALRRLGDARIRLVETARPSPLAFPLLLEQLTQKRSSLSLSERVERLRRRYGLG
jgi:ATP-dependent Lhr-like helicase